MALYVVQNPRWLIFERLNPTVASQILESCKSIENGNFLVRKSENKNAKYTITLWFNNTATHVRITQLDNGKYQLEFKPNSILMPTFSTINELIDFYTENPIKLIGHCEGLVKLKFNRDILECFTSQGGAVTYAS